MTDYPFMPVDVAVLIADTNGMTAQEFGAYWRLICHMWLHKGWLPDDNRELQRLAQVDRRHWKTVWEKLIPYLTVEDGKVSQKRVLRERSHINSKTVKPLNNNETTVTSKVTQIGHLKGDNGSNKNNRLDPLSRARAINHNYNYKESFNRGNERGANPTRFHWAEDDAPQPEKPTLEERARVKARYEKLRKEWPQ